MDEHSCPTCERVFDTERGLRVHHSRAHDETLPNRECAECGSPFHEDHEQKYCSEDCRSTSVSAVGAANPNYRGGREETTCDICGSSFDYSPSEKEGRFCPACVKSRDWRDPPSLYGSENPGWSGGKLELECAVCDQQFERYPSNATGDIAVCSEPCRQEWLSEAFSGDGHPNWRGGGTGNYGPGWNAVRRAALERDGHECVVCGTDAHELGRNPDVHHVTPVRVFVASDSLEKSDAHELNNVVSLCPSCHRSAEFGGISKNELRASADISD